MENQVLSCFFRKTSFSHREAFLLDFLRQFSISSLLGDVSSRAPHFKTLEMEINTVFTVIAAVSLSECFTNNYDYNDFFGDVYRFLKEENMDDKIRHQKASRMMDFYSI